MRSAGRALAAIVLSTSVAAAQQYVISTYAGAAPPPTPARRLMSPMLAKPAMPPGLACLRAVLAIASMSRAKRRPPLLRRWRRRPAK